MHIFNHKRVPDTTVSGTIRVMSSEIVVIAHDLRSAHNVGSLLRTADGLGVKMVYLTGYTPYPAKKDDSRLPHIAQKLAKQINKTALGAENLVNWQQNDNIDGVIKNLKKQGYVIAALEQNSKSTSVIDFKTPSKLALILGREVEGIEEPVVRQCDVILEIPMRGQKESFNVVQAAAIALYQLGLATTPQ